MILDVDSTINFLIQSNYLKEFFTTLSAVRKKLHLSYERKLYTLAISNMLFNCKILPEII